MATASGGLCKCSSLYKEPRMLACLHTFCLQCLTKAVEIQGAKDSLKCPICDENVALPEGGVEKLPFDLRRAEEAEMVGYGQKLESGNEPCGICLRTDSGPAVSFCVNCCEFLCKLCDEHHRSARKTHKHEIIRVGNGMVKREAEEEDAGGCALVGIFRKPPMPCSVHDDEMLKFYCEDCEMLICRDCMELDHSDHRSRCNRIEAIAAKAIKELTPQTDNFKDMTASLTDTIAQCKEGLNEVDARKKEVEETVTKCLSDVRDTLLLQAEKLHSEKTTSLKSQINELEKIRDAILLASDTVAAFESYTPSQQLATKNVVSERIKCVLEKFNRASAFPLVSTLLVSKLGFPSVIDKVVGLGAISGGCDPASSRCDVGYIPRAVAGQERVVKVTARSKGDGGTFPHGSERVDGELITMDEDKISVKGTSTDHGDGTYSVAFTAQSVGACDFHVRIGGQPILGSPFSLTSRPAQTAAIPGSFSFRIHANPNDVAFTSEGSVVVAECGYHTVSLYSVTGNHLRMFGKQGAVTTDISGFNTPLGVAVNGDTLYVADSKNSCVKVINLTTARVLSSFGHSGCGRLSAPKNVCIDPEGKVFVTDPSKKSVQVFQSDGTHAYTINGCNEESNLSYPRGLAFDASGRLHIADNNANCIKIFTPDGVYVESYGSGTIATPYGIAIDEEGCAVITGAYQYKVWVYSLQHHTQQLISTHEYNNCPTGVGFDGNGVLWISQYQSNRVTKCCSVNTADLF